MAMQAGYGQMQSSPTSTVKIVIVGDGAVGKTCMLVSYTTKTFPSEYVPTIFDNYSANVEAMKNGRREQIKLMLYDTAGQEDYKQIRPLSYPGTSVFIVCYSVDNRTSFGNVKSAWIPEITEHCPGTPWILCGTKADLADDKQVVEVLRNRKSPIVTDAEGKKMAAALGGLVSLQCSAMTQKGLKEVFDKAISIGMGGGGSEGGGCCIVM